jgi:hypothetical protein
MNNSIRKIIWSITTVFLLFGLLPYKLPQFSRNEETEIVIYSPECILEIPDKFKKSLPKKVFEITLEKGHEINKLNWNLLKTGNRFIVSATIIDVDSIGVNPTIPCNAKAIVRINDWAPRRYVLNILSFDPKWLFPYLVTGLILLLMSIIVLFWKKK